MANNRFQPSDLIAKGYVKLGTQWVKRGSIGPLEAQVPVAMPKATPQPSKRRKTARAGSYDPFLGAWREPPTPEFRFDPDRRWRFDYAFLPQRVAVEVQGGIWTNGRHTRGAALLKEWEKLNRAAELGWRVFYVQPSELTSGLFLAQLSRTLTPE